MALTIFGGTNADLVAGIPADVTIEGVDEIISITVRRVNSVQIEAKAQSGDIAAIAYGGEKFEMEAEGYTTASSVPSVTGAEWTAFGCTGKVMSAEIVGSNEDFVKLRISGLGMPTGSSS
jgi:hypothetical protein